MAVQKESEIRITVGLDENKIPETITWDATDGGVSNEQAKALMMGVWDDKNSECLRIDLWTKDMPVDEMNVFIHQTLVSLSQSFFKATNNEKMTDAFKQFCDYFAKNLNLNKN